MPLIWVGAGPEWAEETKNPYRSFLNRVQLHRTDRQRDTIRHRAHSRQQTDTRTTASSDGNTPNDQEDRETETAGPKAQLGSQVSRQGSEQMAKKRWHQTQKGESKALGCLCSVSQTISTPQVVPHSRLL